MKVFGFYNINKPVGPTSHDIVYQVRRAVGRKVKVGHTGTLDPFAGGVLVIAVGPATRLADYVQAAPKRYRAEVTLGATSTTDDIEGDITPTPDVGIPAAEQVQQALDQFSGRIMQSPPAFSAVHVNGERAYERARDGEQVAPAAREVTVHSISLLAYEYPRVELDIVCGAGTYIRSIARDLGDVLRIAGYCSELVRLAVGDFVVDSAVEAETLDVAADLISPLAALADMDRFVLPPDQLPVMVHGRMLDASQMTRRESHDKRSTGNVREVALVDHEDNLLAIGDLYISAKQIHPRKVFVQL
ncbi:MAG: tRNA pseudouridine(55) synthase TruB [Planctomycetota bacterium]